MMLCFILHENHNFLWDKFYQLGAKLRLHLGLICYNMGSSFLVQPELHFLQIAFLPVEPLGCMPFNNHIVLGKA